MQNYAHPWELIIDDGSADANGSPVAAESNLAVMRVFELNRILVELAMRQVLITHAETWSSPRMAICRPPRHPMLLEELLTRDLDMVSGWRKNHKTRH